MTSISVLTTTEKSTSKVSTHAALLETRRLLFENRKKFPGVDYQQKREQPEEQQRVHHSDDSAVAARNSTLFANVTGDGYVAGSSPTCEALPSAAELDRLLPSLQQLRDEIPSSTEVRRAVERGDKASMWVSNAVKRDEDDEE